MKITDTYPQVIQKTTAMVRDGAVQRLAQKHGLHVLDVNHGHRQRARRLRRGTDVGTAAVFQPERRTGQPDRPAQKRFPGRATGTAEDKKKRLWGKPTGKD